MLFALADHPYTGYSTDFSTNGKDTLYAYLPPSPKSTPPVLWQEYSVRPLHVVAEGGCRRHPPALLATYPGSLPLPKSGLLSCFSPLLHCCPLLDPNKNRGAHYCFGLAKVFLEPYPLKHPYHSCQSHLYSDGIFPRYKSVVLVEDDDVLTCRTYKYLVCLLRPKCFQ